MHRAVVLQQQCTYSVHCTANERNWSKMVSSGAWICSLEIMRRCGRDSLLPPMAALRELKALNIPPEAARRVLCCACMIISADSRHLSEKWETTRKYVHRHLLRRARACDPQLLIIELVLAAPCVLVKARLSIASLGIVGGSAVRWRDAAAIARRRAEDWFAI